MRASAREQGVWWLLALWALGAAFKLSLADTLVFDYDIVPVVALGWEWLQGGAFPVYGTLSSVAAYNLPGLVWLHLPMLIITQSPFLTMVFTLLLFNMVGTFAAFALARDVAGAWAGLLAAALFTVSETSFGAVTVAWAQLLLPTFCVLLALCLRRWWRTGRGAWMLASGVVALLAFMTHFSAVLLLPVCVVFWLLSGAVVRVRWALLLGAVCAALLLPYLRFQVERDFVDLRAFLTRQGLVPAEVLEPMRVEVARLAREQRVALPTPSQPPAARAAAEPESRLLRFVLRLPGEVERVVRSQTQLLTRPPAGSALALVEASLTTAGRLALVLMTLAAGWQVLRRVVQRMPRRAWWGGRRGNFALITLLPLSLVAGLLVLRVFPTEQPTYLAGIQGWASVLVAIAVAWGAGRWRGAVPLLGGAAACVLLLGVLTYAERSAARADALFPQAWYYRTLEAIASEIARRSDSATVRVAYELWPQQTGYAWVPAWHMIDQRYRLGMALDFILLASYGLQNTNLNPFGTDEKAKFVVRFAPDVGERVPLLVVNQMALLPGRAFP